MFKRTIIILIPILLSIYVLHSLKDKYNYTLCTWSQPTESNKPVQWPIDHPYWYKSTSLTTGYWNMYAIVRGDQYDAINSIKESWPEAMMLNTKSAPFFTFSSFMTCPEWFDPIAWDTIQEQDIVTN